MNEMEAEFLCDFVWASGGFCNFPGTDTVLWTTVAKSKKSKGFVHLFERLFTRRPAWLVFCHEDKLIKKE
ncbi:hypothetical protein [Guptibacillus sedimenti]|uniref:hypothetical protein n=1 Tax=Guptibacillus sedimenti TaxID=3025680 RepID=UPI00235EC8B3|nr:hypothetical protein [Pseudalkalibacillus sedimenti]